MERLPVRNEGRGALLYVSPEMNYHGYPTGMGGRQAISKQEFRASGALVELGMDWIGEIRGKQVLMCRLMNERPMRMRIPDPPAGLDANWARRGNQTHIHRWILCHQEIHISIPSRQSYAEGRRSDYPIRWRDLGAQDSSGHRY
jgi:hypothetical protein